jgi:hypothetical protein
LWTEGFPLVPNLRQAGVSGAPVRVGVVVALLEL